MANVKFNLLELEKVSPIEATIKRPTRDEYVNSEVPHMLDVVIRSLNVNMLKAFEHNPQSETLKNLATLASITQALCLIYRSEISPIEGLGGSEETYKKYLTLMNASAETLFGKDSKFAKKLYKITTCEEPGVENTADATLRMNILMDEMYESVLFEKETGHETK